MTSVGGLHQCKCGAEEDDMGDDEGREPAEDRHDVAKPWVVAVSSSSVAVSSDLVQMGPGSGIVAGGPEPAERLGRR